jgi:oligoribonuclease
MTGLDHNKEMIMEIGCIITNSELGEIARQPSIIIHVPEETLKGMGPWCVKHHGDVCKLSCMCQKSN